MTDVVAVTAVVLIGNEALKVPPETETLAGTEAAPLLLVKLTTIPPAGAAAFKKMYPMADAPPISDAGEVVRVDSHGCGTRVLVSVVVPKIAEMYTAAL